MKVILAKHHGFCYGVKRAVKIAQDSVSLEGKAYTLGPIIHNPQMVEKLANEGVGMVHSLDDIRQGTVIVRSHGVGPKVYEQAEEKGLTLVDATCPHVKKAQMAAYELSEAGYQVIIVGEKSHPEVKSIFEWSKNRAIIIEHEAELNDIVFFNKVGVVAQTTFSGEEFQKIVDSLIERVENVKVERTICNATEKRQEAAVELANQVDMMIVIGGKNSANTTRLAELCLKKNKHTYHIETVNEINDNWFNKGINTIGITAGASTPDWLIEEVYHKMNQMENFLGDDLKEIQQGDIVQGKIISIYNNEVFVDIGYKSEGIIPINELAFPQPENIEDIIKIGDKIDVFVVEVDGKNGLLLSKIRADKVVAWDKIKDAMLNKTVLELKVLEAVKAGLVLSVFGLRGFVPASQIDLHYIEDLTQYVGNAYSFIIIEVDKDKQKVILSRRSLLEIEKAKKENELFDSLAINQILEGSVKRFVKYGAFIDIGGFDGLLHISDMAWHRVKDPAEIMSIGDIVKVMVTKIDKEAKRISLSLKDIVRDPWLDKVDLIKEGMIVQGKVTKLMDFGAFVKFNGALEGLVRLNELTEKRIHKAEEVVNIGDDLKVKVIQIDRKNKRIGLSLLQVKQDAEREEFKKYIQHQEAVNDTLGDKFGHLFKNFSD
ncbi:bifunctional 4-hydroxy-3-methylbut-2-enyl diphosphate reductase/30S ribosomal protein S1 [Anaerosinus gibii]|uniref:4-hydroxy-3-methylbut-2-enyl diphosphate reductase n=1 Tax=Selenobaculum gibii TaxID=3054208 RepID=A0A9Y2AH66_9FIRM|nr:bifunctional 4-hydroxy-3-methylbut-2-enyl diphosphate reductase/30S ribosomal protein S1 [Selenobaculum gbiensis]WIW69628.1 bifunctional 4-hydroxy-3-methylbut-2-enyl diphosphate reductase/30S ribosomal protein S1 [Selenobaculum gbiensis]